MRPEQDCRVDDRDSASGEKGHAGASQHMKQTGRSRLRVAWPITMPGHRTTVVNLPWLA